MWFWRNKLNPDTYINLIQIVSQIKEKIKMQYEERYCSSPTCEKKATVNRAMELKKTAGSF